MKLSVLLSIIAVMLVAAGAIAATKSALPVDGYGVRIQGCAPTVKNDASLTGKSQTISVDGAVCWQAYGASDVKFRAMTTATRVGVQHTLPGGAWYTGVASDYKFLHMSGSTGTFRSNKP